MRGYHLTDSEVSLGQNITTSQFRAIYQTGETMGFRDQWTTPLRGQARSTQVSTRESQATGGETLTTTMGASSV